jgi:hypothetical protein
MTDLLPGALVVGWVLLYFLWPFAFGLVTALVIIGAGIANGWSGNGTARERRDP